MFRHATLSIYMNKCEYSTKLLHKILKFKGMVPAIWNMVVSFSYTFTAFITKKNHTYTVVQMHAQFSFYFDVYAVHIRCVMVLWNSVNGMRNSGCRVCVCALTQVEKFFQAASGTMKINLNLMQGIYNWFNGFESTTWLHRMMWEGENIRRHQISLKITTHTLTEIGARFAIVIKRTCCCCCCF